MSGPGRARGGGSVGFLVAAVALITVVVGLVIAFGVVRPPALASVADGGPEAPGGVAYVQWDDKAGCQRLHVVRPDASRATSDCESSIDQIVGWTSDGILVAVWADAGQVLWTFDPETLAVIGSTPTSATTHPTPAEQVSVTFSDSGRMTVYSMNDHTALWSVDSRGGYGVESGIRSPDGRWFALLDTAGRILLVPADGSAAPRVWEAGIASSRWPGLVWQGTAPEAEPG